MRVAFSAARAAVCMGGREAVCTIGNFDGVHRGHEALIRRTTTRAHELGLPSLLITFEPHPAQVLSTRVVQGLSSRVQRLERFAALGVDVALLLPFTRDFASRRAEEFCRHVLADTLRVRQLVLGYDFCMGSDQAGAETLVGCGREFGFDVSCVSAVMYEGVPVSSSRIRKAVEAGYLEHARAMLGRPYARRSGARGGTRRAAAGLCHGKYGYPGAGHASARDIRHQRRKDCAAGAGRGWLHRSRSSTPNVFHALHDELWAQPDLWGRFTESGNAYSGLQRGYLRHGAGADLSGKTAG